MTADHDENMSDEDYAAAQLAGTAAMDITIPRLPRSKRGTWKGKGSTKGRSYKSGKSKKG